MTIRKPLAIVAITCFAFASYTQADDHKGPKHHPEMPKFEKMDTNADGAISFDEFLAAHRIWMQKKFNKMDQDHNGTVSKAELQAARKKMKARMQERKHGAGDGSGGGDVQK